MRAARAGRERRTIRAAAVAQAETVPTTSATVALPLARVQSRSCARLRKHCIFGGVLVVGVVLRLLAMLAYRPALFFSDSWAYLSTAFAHHIVSLPYLRPVGYSVLLRVLMTPGRDVTAVVALQHLAGLAIGGGIYATLLRSQVRPAFAAAAAALVLLDGYAITLEQYLMPDTFYALTLLAAAMLLTWPQLSPTTRTRAPSACRTALAGLLLAAAAFQREVGLFALPVAVIYLAWARVGWRPLLAFIVAAAVPLGSYAGIMDAKTGVFGLTATSGWNLYSRVAGFTSCPGARIPPATSRLCETPDQRARHPRVPDWYMWDAASPAIRLFHRGHETHLQRARANRLLGQFARGIIRHQPAAFVSAIAGDFLRYFTPGATPYADSVSATSLPRSASRETVDESIRRRVIPHVRPRVQAPASFVRDYRVIVHVPRPALALLAIAALAGVVLRLPSRRETLLFSGTALLLLIGTSTTAGFALRYLLPTVPLLAIGGGLAARDAAMRFSPSRPCRTGSGE